MKKKLFAVLMAMVLVLGMSTTALAENNNSPRIDTSNWDSPYWDNSPEVGDIVWNGIAYDYADDAKVEVPEGYEDGIQLDISFMIDDYSVETTLIVPVTITMPIPAGVEKENLVILHYHGDAETPDVIVPTVNADGTMTFIVGGFSTFVVTNEVVEAAPETPANPEAPKTGDVSTTTTVCSLLLLAAGVVLISKRKSFVK